LTSSILSADQMYELGLALPVRFQCKQWRLAYRISEDGASLGTLLRRFDTSRTGDGTESGASVLLVKTTDEDIFGGFATISWAAQKGYFGTGQCFLFSFKGGMRVAPWSRSNDYFQICTVSELAFGGGGNGFGLRLDKDFRYGSSAACATFQGEAVGPEIFEVAELEVFTFPHADVTLDMRRDFSVTDIKGNVLSEEEAKARYWRSKGVRS